MAKDKTPIATGAPVFGIGETAYVRSSALKGYIEPIVIAKVRFDPSISAFVYRWLKSSLLKIGFAAQAQEKDLAPFEIREEEILTLCEALPIHISVLEQELEKAESQLPAVEVDPPPAAPVPVQSNFQILQPPVPRFAFNEVVYLIDTAEATGRLEKMRIEALNFDTIKQEWRYSAVFRRKPGENATVGGRNDLRRDVVIDRLESELATFAEVIPIRIDFLQTALNASNLRLNSCEEGSG